MPSHECVTDNQGFCWFCKKPMNFDYWLSSIGPTAYRNWRDYIDEWQNYILEHRSTDDNAAPDRDAV